MSLRRNPWFWVAVASGAALLVVVLLVASVIPISSDRLREKVISTLSEQLDAKVELASMDLTILPLRIRGAGLTIRHRGRTDVPPLISIRSFSVKSTIPNLLKHRITHMAVDGLDIEIPPSHNADEEQPPDADKPISAGTRATTGTGDATPTDHRPVPEPVTSVIVSELVTTDARLVILPDDRSAPKVWAIHRLRMESVSLDRPMPFEATLTNAVPPGEIETTGHFGPWQREVPGRTPLDGHFVFAKADLSVFKGISGILSAHGTFGGALNRIDVHGETDTPDFTVAVGGHPLPLHATYHTLIDGTNGNTVLERIDASFLNTSLVARGSVLDTPGPEGRAVKLDVTIDRGRLEDILKLAVNTPKTPMVGALSLKTGFLLPPGETDVARRLQLDGRFKLTRARFTDKTVQKKIFELSQRSRGKPDEVDRPGASSMASNFEGRFVLGHGVLRLPSVSFDVPGATVRLAGDYGILSGNLDFAGTLEMQAKVSQTTTGIKRLLLKAIDPLFSRKGGGSQIPIKISGKRSDPQFGLDRGRIFHRDKS